MLRCSTIYAFSICFSVARIALSYAMRFRMVFSVSVSGNCSYAFSKSCLRCSKWIISSDACLFSRSALIRRLYSDTALRRSFSSCSGLFTFAFRAYTVRECPGRAGRRRFFDMIHNITTPAIINTDIMRATLSKLDNGILFQETGPVAGPRQVVILFFRVLNAAIFICFMRLKSAIKDFYPIAAYANVAA